MKVNAIFYSLQGEGILSGLPTVFIRLTGCNLRCQFCDTKYAYFEGEELSIDEIIRQVKRYRSRNVCLTGGEPLLQEKIYDLLNELEKLHYKTIIETNGSKNINDLLTRFNLSISLDIKCPSSGMQNQMLKGNISKLREIDQLKFVVQSKEDYQYGIVMLQKYRPVCTVYFQPVWGFNPKQVAQWLLDDGIEARLGLQLHKIIWGAKTKK
jgi:7-carboxy-7-deazaguanine synthase